MNLPFRFDDGFIEKINPEEFKKYLYIGTKLYGIGKGNTYRKAKIECAKIALDNLKHGR
jgi:dsRNA-specific ribonuclease